MILGAIVALALSGLYAPETPPEPKPVEIIAQEVADGLWGNGEARAEKLKAAGYSLREVQDIVNAIMPVEKAQHTERTESRGGWVPDPDGSVITPRGGVNWYFDQYETYYNLPMQGVVAIARAHGIGGEYWVRSDGAKMLGDYIMLATNNDVYPIGTLVPCSLGMGISLDTGTFAASNPYQIDIAVDWE